MKKILHTLSILILLMSFGKAEADAGNEANVPIDVIKNYIPNEVKISPITGESSIYLKDLSAQTARVNFARGREYVVILYSNIEKCSLIVLHKVSKEYIAARSTEVAYTGALSGCSSLAIKDLNGDNSDEVIVYRDSGRDSLPPAIFKWDRDHLVDVTPVETIDGKTNNSFRDVSITDKPVQGRLLIFDYDSNDNTAKRRLYTFDGKKIVLNGEYDLVSYIPASKVTFNKHKFEIQDAADISHSFPEEGQYVLTVKNVSDHTRAVRAEVTVNGSVVLKPQDFCSAPPHKRTDKKWWIGHDDDDDNDNDHFKRCIPKNEAYAIVNMKTANEIKVKVYGRKDSKVQLTLMKK